MNKIIERHLLFSSKLGLRLSLTSTSKESFNTWSVLAYLSINSISSKICIVVLTAPSIRKSSLLHNLNSFYSFSYNDK